MSYAVTNCEVNLVLKFRFRQFDSNEDEAKSESWTYLRDKHLLERTSENGFLALFDIQTLGEGCHANMVHPLCNL